jgi:hypothetical protein
MIKKRSTNIGCRALVLHPNATTSQEDITIITPS